MMYLYKHLSSFFCHLLSYLMDNECILLSSNLFGVISECERNIKVRDITSSVTNITSFVYNGPCRYVFHNWINSCIYQKRNSLFLLQIIQNNRCWLLLILKNCTVLQGTKRCYVCIIRTTVKAQRQCRELGEDYSRGN